MPHRKQIDNTKPLLIGLALNTSFTVVELVVGFASGSLALIADGMRNLTDSITLSVAFMAERMSRRKSDHSRTFGYGRIKIIASLLNTGALVTVAIYIVYQALSRFGEPRALNGLTIAIVAAGGAIVNGTAAWLLHKQRKDLNIGATYTGLLYGAIGSVGILMAGVLIGLFHLYWIDDLAGIAVAVMLLYASYHLTRDAMHILLEGVPVRVHMHDLKASLLALEGVVGLTEVHAWTIDANEYAFSCHINVEYADREGSYNAVTAAKELLHDTYGFTHTTIEVKLIPQA